MSARWHILGPELRAAREATGATLRKTARRLLLAPSTLSLAERGGPVLGRETLLVLAHDYGVCPAVADRWLALAGHLPADLESALLDHPERWDDVRELLRETTYVAPPMFGDADLSTHTDDKGRRRMVGYVASMDHESLRCAEDYGIKQTPAVHMPRWAARILLDVVSVRVERLHAIDDAEAELDGVRFFDPEHLWDPDIVWDPRPFTPREVFAGLWGLINGDESWRANPWVWRIEFRRVGAEVSRD